MRCNKAREYISHDMDGQLPPERAGRLARHLEDCEDCCEYRDDLVLGNRLLAASDPELSENFDWRLQLKLNQTLREAAGQAAYPWQESRPDRVGWLRNFGAAAAVGMAAVLAVSLLLGPEGGEPVAPQFGEPGVGAVADGTPFGGGDRRSIINDGRLGGGISGQPVTTGGGFSNSRPAWLQDTWSYQSVDDLRSLQRLQQENRHLRTRVVEMERQMRVRESRLDSTGVPALDLEER